MDLLLLTVLRRPGAFVDPDELPAAKNFYREQEEPWIAQYQARLTYAPALTDDEASAGLKNFYRDDDPPYVAQYQACLVYPPAASDDEASAGLANFGLEDELPYVAQVEARPWLPLPFGDDEISAGLKNFYREQEEPWVAQAQARPWLPLPFSDDDAVTPSAGLDDDPPFIAQVQARLTYPPATADEDAGAALKNFYREQEEPWVAQAQARPWLPLPFTDDDVRVSPGAIDDDAPFLAQYQAILAYPPAASDDEASAQLKNFYREQEEPWLAQGQARPWLPLPFTDDEIRVSPGAVDDDPPFLAQVQARLTYPPAIADEDAGTALKNFYREQEDGWAAQAWAVPRPRPAASDDEALRAVVTAGLDEDDAVWLLVLLPARPYRYASAVPVEEAAPGRVAAIDPRVSDHRARATPTPDLEARSGALSDHPARAGLTLDLKASAKMSVYSALEMYRGEDRTFRFTFYPVPSGGIAGYTLTFGFRLATATTPLVSKSCVITDADAGEFTVTLDSADTAALDAGEYVWDVRRQPAGYKDTVANGTLDILAEVIA